MMHSAVRRGAAATGAMVDYSDPTGAPILSQLGALDAYRILIDARYDAAAREPRSAFTWLEAIPSAPDRTTTTVAWQAFPQVATASEIAIDTNRFNLQDEYVEWRTERDGPGRVQRVTFTTEFTEWFQALATLSFDALAAGILSAIPNAQPTPRELFGVDSNPASMTPRERARRFARARDQNPWNNGARGILCLSHPSNTMGALFSLLSECAKPRLDVPPGDLCASVGNACVPGRSSDPAVCTAAQETARNRRALTLADPVAIRLLELTGVWQLDGKDIDINDPTKNEGLWEITRGGSRGILTNAPGLRVANTPITSGAQIARQLRVGATVITIPETRLPVWARTGNEVLGRGGAG